MNTPVFRPKTNTRKLIQRLTPNQYRAPPVGATVVPPEPYIGNEWDQPSSSSSSSKKKIVAPFHLNGAGADRALVRERNYAATRLPLKALDAAKSLLQYPIRRAAAKSLLFGGVRTTGLNMTPPDLAVTHSEELTLPTREEERRDLRWDAPDSGFHLLPSNMHPQMKLAAWHNRCIDLNRRLKKEMTATQRRRSGNNNNMFKRAVRFVQPHSSTLRIEPYSDAEWKAIRAESAAAREACNFNNSNNNNNTDQAPLQPAQYTQRDAYMPFQSLKPHGYGVWSAAMRSNSYLRYASHELHQERLNRKGFGWKTIQRGLWQQDTDTERYRPDRGY